MKGNFNLTASIAEKGPSITNFISKIIKDGVSMQDIDEYLNILSHQDIKKMNIRGFDLEYKRNRIASFNVVKSKITDFKLVIFPQSLLDGCRFSG